MRSPFLWLTLVLSFSACAGTGGQVRVVREVDLEVDPAKAARIAASLVGPLREIDASLPRWEACLLRQTCQPEAFLAETETALLRALSEPELAGMRDWVREEFRYRESEIGFYRSSRGASQTGRVADVLNHGWDLAGGRSSPGSVSRAELEAGIPAGRLSLSQGPPRERSFWDRVVPGVFGSVARLVRRTRELVEGNELVTQLCVQSNPPQAQFLLWPSSEPARSANAVSVGTLVIYRGLYAYEITWDGNAYRCDPEPNKFGTATRSCPKVDLVNDDRPVFLCVGRAGAQGKSWQCDRRTGPLNGCTPQR